MLAALRTLALLLAAGALLLALFVSRNWNRLWDEVPTPNLHASTDPRIIARGRYLVTGPAHCAECHTGSIAEYERSFSSKNLPVLAGGSAFRIGPAGNLGTVYSKNLTPDP